MIAIPGTEISPAQFQYHSPTTSLSTWSKQKKTQSLFGTLCTSVLQNGNKESLGVEKREGERARLPTLIIKFPKEKKNIAYGY